MSAMKTVAGFAVVAAVLAFGAKAQRAPALEDDQDVRRVIESATRANAADFNPNVSLTQSELKDFRFQSFQISRPRIIAMMSGEKGGSYEVYVRFRESDSDRCLTLNLERAGEGSGWSARRAGSDRCTPIW